MREGMFSSLLHPVMQIFDLLKLKVVIHNDAVVKWLDESCAIPVFDNVIVINPQKRRLLGILF